MSHDIRIPIKTQPGWLMVHVKAGWMLPLPLPVGSGSLHHCRCGCLDVAKLDQPGQSLNSQLVETIRKHQGDMFSCFKLGCHQICCVFFWLGGLKIGSKAKDITIPAVRRFILEQFLYIFAQWKQHSPFVGSAHLARSAPPVEVDTR